MNKLSIYTEYLTKSHKELYKLSRQIHTSFFYLWYDFIKCSIIHGVILKHYIRGGFYKIKGCERKESMTYGRILKAFKIMNSPESINKLNCKHLFNSHFNTFVKRQWLYSEEMKFNEFNDICNKCNVLIIKPEGGMEGDGIHKITSPKNEKDKKIVFEELKSGCYMIEECIKQHSDMVYGNTSINTIRAHTIMDRNGDVHLGKMIFRVGVGDSVVDNYAHGGCAYEVDIETGRIISPSLSKDGTELYIHPLTDIFMLGRQIPNWDKVKEGVTTAHKMLKGCRFIGWDVAITDDGIELIEGNHNTDYEFFEFFGTKGWWSKIKKYI